MKRGRGKSYRKKSRSAMLHGKYEVSEDRGEGEEGRMVNVYSLAGGKGRSEFPYSQRKIVTGRLFLLCPTEITNCTSPNQRHDICSMRQPSSAVSGCGSSFPSWVNSKKKKKTKMIRLVSLPVR